MEPWRQQIRDDYARMYPPRPRPRDDDSPCFPIFIALLLIASMANR